MISGRIIMESGNISVKTGNKTFKKRYLRACCGGMKEQPAKLEFFDDIKAAIKGKKRLIEIIFTKVKQILESSEDNKRLIVIEMIDESDGICFYSDIETEHKKWVRYCGLLSTIPNYAIPEEPKYNLVPPEFIDKYADPGKFDAVSVWVVYIINEDIGNMLGYEGLHIIGIRRNSTLCIHNFHTKSLLLSWDRDKLRRSGGIGCLGFMEVGRRCYGGPGLLWMYCPVSVAGKFRECLHDFLFYGPEGGSKNGLGASPRFNSMLTTHPSLRRRSNDGDSRVGHTIQHAISQETTTSSSSRLNQDLQFPYNSGRGTPNSNIGKSESSNKQLDGGFRPCGQQLSSTREQYINPPIKPRIESAPEAVAKESEYVHMNSSANAQCMSDNSNYVNHAIPADIKPPVENYENTGFHAMRVSLKGTETLANIQEQAPLDSNENHALRKNTYVNIIKPFISEHKDTSGAAAPAVRCYENVQLNPPASQTQET